jgi:hypothetical protein
MHIKLLNGFFLYTVQNRRIKMIQARIRWSKNNETLHIEFLCRKIAIEYGTFSSLAPIST